MNNKIFDQLMTGDLVIFSGVNSILSDIVEISLSSIWSHIGIVVKNPNFLMNKDTQDGLFLLNSDGNYETDIESGVKKIGVQINNLKQKINDYDGQIIVRYLLTNTSRTSEENERRNKLFTSGYQTIFDKPYDYIPLDLLITVLNDHHITLLDNVIDDRHLDHIFCSALVAYIYTSCDIMDKNTKWSLITPDVFVKDANKNYYLCNNYYLSPIQIIKDTKGNINEIEQKSNICVML